MFLLDTNILSAMMNPRQVPEVAAWLPLQPDHLLFTTAICQAEIFAGLAIMAPGQRREALRVAAQRMFANLFADRVLPFDVPAALAYAEIFATCRRTGRPVGTIDLMIAAIARSLGASVVTRNVTDFDACGVPIINPWEA